MARLLSRRSDATRIHYFPAQPGSRAVFLAEARTKKEMRQIRELFDMVGRLAQVVPISHGTVMAYGVQVHGDTSIFGKIEWLLKTQFFFSVVERNFSDVTYDLVKSLCQDSSSQLVELPSCGICASVDPFPTRATVELKDVEDPLHLAYCSKCAAKYAEEAEDEFIRNLVGRDRSRVRVPRETEVIVMPEIVDERPEWESEDLAIAM